MLPHLFGLIAFWGKKRWRWLRFGRYINKQKVPHGLCQRLTGGDPATVVAFGDSTFSSSSRGHAAGPILLLCSELRKRCRVRLEYEYNTSQICSNCNGRLTGNPTFWTLRMCPTCWARWNRDVNAARNIRNIFLYANAHNGQRLGGFWRGEKMETSVEYERSSQGEGKVWCMIVRMSDDACARVDGVASCSTRKNEALQHVVVSTGCVTCYTRIPWFGNLPLPEGSLAVINRAVQR